jgi:ABC-type phosphate transport system auxiliary subunit
VKAELEAVMKGKSEEELEKEKEVQETMAAKVCSLAGSFGKMSHQTEALRNELKRLEETDDTPTKTSKKAIAELAKKKEQLVTETAKVGAILETLEGELKQKLQMAKANADTMSLELASIRERWRLAKDDVTDAQAELDQCRSRITQVRSTLVFHFLGLPNA